MSPWVPDSVFHPGVSEGSQTQPFSFLLCARQGFRARHEWGFAPAGLPPPARVWCWLQPPPPPGPLGSGIARAPRCRQQGRGSPVLHHGGLRAAISPSPCGAQSQRGSVKEPDPAPCGASAVPSLCVLPGGAGWRGERPGPCWGLSSSRCILQNAARLAPLDWFYAEEGLPCDGGLCHLHPAQPGDGAPQLGCWLWPPAAKRR